jgi:hypothetical protein
MKKRFSREVKFCKIPSVHHNSDISPDIKDIIQILDVIGRMRTISGLARCFIPEEIGFRKQVRNLEIF